MSELRTWTRDQIRDLQEQVEDEPRPRGARTQPRPAKTGRKSAEIISYEVAHLRVKTKRGFASEHICVKCGEPAREWAYDQTDPSAHADDRGRIYSVKTDHYMPLCRACHRRFDASPEWLAARQAMGVIHEVDRPRGRPPTEAGTPPARAIRVHDELWEAARVIARARGESLPEVVRRALERYVARHRRDLPWKEDGS